ncbi:hypothetical protein AAVH_36336, partial [Aphelenchoides avenae]
MTVQLADDGDAIDSFLEPLWKHITPHDYHPALDGATILQDAALVHVGQIFVILVTVSHDFAILCDKDDPET